MKDIKSSCVTTSIWKRPLARIMGLFSMNGRQRNGRTAFARNPALMKLGEHLLRDVGFDAQGRPLKPERMAGSTAAIAKRDGHTGSGEAGQGRQCRDRTPHGFGVDAESAPKVKPWVR